MKKFCSSEHILLVALYILILKGKWELIKERLIDFNVSVVHICNKNWVVLWVDPSFFYNLKLNIKRLLTLNDHSVVTAVEENCVDGALLNVRVKESGANVVVGQANCVAHQLFWLDVRVWSIQVVLVRNMNTVNTNDSWVHQKTVVFWNEMNIFITNITYRYFTPIGIEEYFNWNNVVWKSSRNYSFINSLFSSNKYKGNKK